MQVSYVSVHIDVSTEDGLFLRQIMSGIALFNAETKFSATKSANRSEVFFHQLLKGTVT